MRGYGRNRLEKQRTENAAAWEMGGGKGSALAAALDPGQGRTTALPAIFTLLRVLLQTLAFGTEQAALAGGTSRALRLDGIKTAC